MKAILLSAGRGLRLRPLTEQNPKPLLRVGGKPLIVYHLENLARANILEIVINLGHLGDKLKQYLGDGRAFGLNIQYSEEDPILDTGGGIKHALKLLGKEPFLSISSDIFTDFPFEKLTIAPESLAHIVLTENPPHHPKGDFVLDGNKVSFGSHNLLNFAGIGVYRPELFLDFNEEPFPLIQAFKKAIDINKMTGEYFQGIWYNIGTESQLHHLNLLLSEKSDSDNS